MLTCLHAFSSVFTMQNLKDKNRSRQRYLHRLIICCPVSVHYNLNYAFHRGWNGRSEGGKKSLTGYERREGGDGRGALFSFSECLFFLFDISICT